jgi:hypothetical protein
MEAPQNKRFYFEAHFLFLPFGPPIYVKGGQHLAKHRGIKVRCTGEHVGEHIENLMRTH